MALARIVTAVSIVAAVHFLIWFSAFSAVFKAVDSGESLPVVSELLLGLVLNILGAPCMFLLYLPTRWWDDDTSFAIGLAMLNSLLWGCIVVWAYRFVRRRRETPPDAT